MKNLPKYILAICTLSLLAGCSSELVSQKKDPLADIIQKPAQNMLKADFLTPEPIENFPIDKVELSPDHTACIKKNNYSYSSQQVQGTFDKAPDMNRDEMLSSIAPVLGYAVNYLNINWIWNHETSQYIFLTAPDDEVFWMCYFKTNDFFNVFLKDVDIVGEAGSMSLRLRKTEYSTEDDPLLALLRDGRILLSWNIDNDARSYEIQYYKKDTPDDKKIITSKVNTKLIGGLTPDTTYLFQVRTVYNDRSKGVFSDPLEGIFETSAFVKVVYPDNYNK